MRELILRHWSTNRVPVGDDTTALIRDIHQQIGGSVLSVPSGAECLSWIIPPKWTVREAWVETVGGKRIADFAWHPLWLKSYSAPFSGVVSRQELLAHTRSDPERPECLLYDYGSVYRHGEKTAWGFTMPHRLAASLDEPEYRVHIATDFSTGHMEILDYTLPGERPETIYIAAHSCHPGQVNDGLACIAIGMELMRWLAEKPRRYTWRLIVGPEYFAAAALLARGEKIRDLRGGFYLDMLGNGQPLGFARSFAGDSAVDAATRNVLRHHYPSALPEFPYRGLWGNDEMFYDGPDFEIPSIALGRGKWVGYHTDHDNPEHCDPAQLQESLELLQRIAMMIEDDSIPTRTYRGPLYQSRYGIYIDPRVDRRGYDALQDIQRLMDGTRSCLQIAEALGVDFDFVHRFASTLSEHGLAAASPACLDRRFTFSQ